MIRAVFFDVDFTLIQPGPTFQAEGYQRFCASHGITVDPLRFATAVDSAAALLDGPEETLYNAELYVSYTQRIIEGMGGTGESLDACAREIYAQWATNDHFELYDDTVSGLGAVAALGLRIGLISNSHRCLRSFQEHFELRPYVSVALSSAEHGLMKPHASIFREAMRLAGVEPQESVMVGDSVRQDVEGALNAGMRAVLLNRGGHRHPRTAQLSALGVATVDSLHDLPHVLRTFA